MPSSHEWIFIENLTATLKPFQEISLEAGKADATISVIITNISVLKISLKSSDEHANGYRSCVNLCCKKRFGKF